MSPNEMERKIVQKLSFDILHATLCSNKNRAGILYLLNNMPNKQLEAEKIANKLGITHRTTLYHLNILENYDLVEVRKFRNKGVTKQKSLWGINVENGTLSMLFGKICENFSKDEMDAIISRNIERR